MCVRDKWLAATVTFGLALCWLADLLWPLQTGPLVGAWAAAIPWIVSGVGALASMYGSNKSAGAQNKALNQQGQITTLQRDAARELMPWGTSLMKQGGDALTSLLPWYTKAAYGDRSVLQQLIAPELQQIREGYDRPLQQLTELSPRSGTTAASNAAILSGRGDALSRAIMNTRSEGRTGLAGIASQLSGLGAGATGAAFGGLQGASSGNLGMLSQLFNIRQQNADESSAIGAGLVDFLKAYQTWNAGRSTGATPGGFIPGSVAGSRAAGGWG